ncbi:hypothetical protein Tco_1379923 [Tanacetum coccineum]
MGWLPREPYKLGVEGSHLEAEKGKLEAAEASLQQEVKAVKWDRAEVVSKVVPYVDMELVQSDEMAMLIGKLMSSAIFYGRCTTFEEVTNMKEPFDLAKVKVLSEVIADPSVLVESLLSKKPKSFRRPTPTKTHAFDPPTPSQKVTLSFAPTPKLMSPPSAI